MREIFIKILIGVAGFMILLGISIAFIDLKVICVDINNDGYVAAIFSLSGVILFFSALMYQIKEYKLQMTELKESVKAQTKSSEALEEQKRILIEQNINNLIFGLINNFNDFKLKNNIQNVINKLIERHQSAYAIRWQLNLDELRLNHIELNEKFADDIKNIFSETIVIDEEYPLIKQYIQFIYNIFDIIDQNKINLTKDYFTSFFYLQLSTSEIIFLCLSNLVDSGMPFYDNLYWGFNETEKITNLIKKYKGQKIDFKELDNHILTAHFKKLKQNK